MKNIGKELFKIIEEKRLVKKQIAERVGITPTYLSGILRKSSIDCELLDRICKAIDFPASYFFEESKKTNIDIHDIKAQTLVGDAHVNIAATEIDMLKLLLEEKERTIKILMVAKGFTQEPETSQNL